jgi:putative NADH-flavin reductase
MRIVVFGATSRTGLHLLTEAQRRNHQIVAFTRHPDALPDTPALAAVIHNDCRDRYQVRAALDGADAVISLLPGGGRRDPHLAADTARTFTRAMSEAGVRRLVVVSAYPIVGDRSRLPMAILRRVLAIPYADNAEREQIVSASDLDWTIARLNRLTDKPATGAIVTSPDLLVKPHSITRADTAVALLDMVQDATLARTAINVSGR